MFKLHSFQTEFIKALLNNNKAFPPILASDYPAERFNVYRQTVFDGCRRALALTFPYVWQGLAGTQRISADEIVGRFIQQYANWPDSGCLDYWGGAFPQFLTTITELEEASVWSDLAQYEWYCNLASFAKELPKLLPEDLMALSEEQQLELQVQFQPSFFIHYSSFPLGKFVIGLSLQYPRWVIIIRLNNQVMTYEITDDWALFLKKLQAGKNVTEAYEETSAKYPDFDLTAAITFLLQHGLCQKLLIKI